MPVRLTTLLVFLASALLLGLPACGGGGGGGTMGGGGTPPGPPPGGGPTTGLDVRVSTDTPGNELSLVPDVCCDGDRVYAVWYDRRDGNLDIYFNRSFDGGATWLPQDVRLDRGPAGAAGSLIPRICCDGLRVYVAWYDERGGNSDIYVNRSLDGGTTWLVDDVRVGSDIPGAAASREPQIACDGDTVYLTWYDRRDGSYGIYFNRSTDAGATWLAQDVRLDRATPGQSDARLPRMAVDGTRIAIAWTDERSGGSDIYLNRSLDGGATWLVNDVRLNETGAPAGDAEAPDVAIEADHVVVAWQDARDGLFDVYANRSLDGGTTWLPQDARVDRDVAGTADSIAPRVCVRGGAAHVVWEEHRTPNPTVSFSRSDDGGATWAPLETRLDRAPTALAAALRPSIRCCPAGAVVVVWRDDTDGRFDVRLTRSTDGGRTWLFEPLRLDTDDPGAGHSLDPEICCAGDRVYVVWYDQRDGPGDVYFNTASFQ
ncbi:MAG: hypothetical protein QNJ98_11975 [Planctomycetota bacterium]|nr:hypothetical protein [Planctomycetota bacterium]